MIGTGILLYSFFTFSFVKFSGTYGAIVGEVENDNSVSSHKGMSTNRSSPGDDVTLSHSTLRSPTDFLTSSRSGLSTKSRPYASHHLDHHRVS